MHHKRTREGTAPTGGGPRAGVLAAALLMVTGCTGELAGSPAGDVEVALLMPASDRSVALLGIVAWELVAGAPGTQVVGVGAGGYPRGAALFSVREDADTGDPVMVVRGKFGGRGELAFGRGGVLADSLLRRDGVAEWMDALGRDVVAPEDTVGYAAAANCGTSLLRTIRACADVTLACTLAAHQGVDTRECAPLARDCAAESLRTRRCGGRSR